MGIADRDYMRERHRQDRRRRDLRDLLADPDRPFPPVRERSVLVIVVFWLGLGVALYAGFTWLQKQKNVRPATRYAAVVPQRVERAATAPETREREAVAPREESAAGQFRLPAPAAPAVRRSEEPVRQQQTPPTGGTVYLCKGYSGGTFWAQSHCSQHQALIDSIVPVPAGIPFEQQVELAQQHRRQVAQTVNTAPDPSTVAAPAVKNKAECAALDARVEQLDAMARQPQSAQTQDWIRGRREDTRSRQFAIRC